MRSARSDLRASNRDTRFQSPPLAILPLSLNHCIHHLSPTLHYHTSIHHPPTNYSLREPSGGPAGGPLPHSPPPPIFIPPAIPTQALLNNPQHVRLLLRGQTPIQLLDNGVQPRRRRRSQIDYHQQLALGELEVLQALHAARDADGVVRGRVVGERARWRWGIRVGGRTAGRSSG
jgi:hypothetical protein